MVACRRAGNLENAPRLTRHTQDHTDWINDLVIVDGGRFLATASSDTSILVACRALIALAWKADWLRDLLGEEVESSRVCFLWRV